MSTPPPNLPPPSIAPRQRLSIGHLLLWMTGSAIILACYRAVDRGTNLDEPMRVVWSLYQAAYGLAAGAQVASLFVFVGRWAKGLAGFPSQPGHWLLLVRGAAQMIWWAGHLAVHQIVFGGMDPGGSRTYVQWAYYAAALVPGQLVGTAGYALAAAKSGNESRLWRSAFYALLVSYAIGLLIAATSAAAVLGHADFGLGFYQLYYSIGRLLGLVVGGIVLAAAIADPQRRKRDFLHWTGIVAMLFTTLLTVAMPVVMAIFTR